MILKDDTVEGALEVIRLLRNETGITLTQVAKDMGISVGYLSGALNGRVKIPEHTFTSYRVKAFVKKLRQRCPDRVKQGA